MRRCSALKKRYGCFSLPKIPGAKVKKAKSNVNWLARTDYENKTVEFSSHFDELSSKEKIYIALHEQAHLITGPDHNAVFYEALKKLIRKNRVDWEVAYAIEAYNCHKSRFNFIFDIQRIIPK